MPRSWRRRRRAPPSLYRSSLRDRNRYRGGRHREGQAGRKERIRRPDRRGWTANGTGCSAGQPPPRQRGRPPCRRAPRNGRTKAEAAGRGRPARRPRDDRGHARHSGGRAFGMSAKSWWTPAFPEKTKTVYTGSQGRAGFFSKRAASSSSFLRRLRALAYRQRAVEDGMPMVRAISVRRRPPRT